MLGEQIYTSSLYGNEKYADSISFVFLNTGDVREALFLIEKNVSNAYLINLKACWENLVATQSVKKS